MYYTEHIHHTSYIIHHTSYIHDMYIHVLHHVICHVLCTFLEGTWVPGYSSTHTHTYMKKYGTWYEHYMYPVYTYPVLHVCTYMCTTCVTPGDTYIHVLYDLYVCMYECTVLQGSTTDSVCYMYVVNLSTLRFRWRFFTNVCTTSPYMYTYMWPHIHTCVHMNVHLEHS